MLIAGLSLLFSPIRSIFAMPVAHSPTAFPCAMPPFFPSFAPLPPGGAWSLVAILGLCVSLPDAARAHLVLLSSAASHGALTPMGPGALSRTFPPAAASTLLPPIPTTASFDAVPTFYPTAAGLRAATPGAPSTTPVAALRDGTRMLVARMVLLLAFSRSFHASPGHLTSSAGFRAFAPLSPDAATLGTFTRAILPVATARLLPPNPTSSLFANSFLVTPTASFRAPSKVAPFAASSFALGMWTGLLVAGMVFVSSLRMTF